MLFLDTEWADDDGQELVSLALLSEDGRHSFYAERDPLPQNPTPFVRLQVYPLLDGGAVSIDCKAYVTALRAFLASIADPLVVYNDSNDAILLQRALHGFDLSPKEALSCGPVPTVSAVLDADPVLLGFTKRWFAQHPAAKRHHALVDATALRDAWVLIHRSADRP